MSYQNTGGAAHYAQPQPWRGQVPSTQWQNSQANSGVRSDYRPRPYNGNRYRPPSVSAPLSLFTASRLGRLEKHLTENLTRYRELYLRLERQPEYEKISEAVIEKRMISDPACQDGGWMTAAVWTLYDNYSRCNMPHGGPAMWMLLEWAWYLRAHCQDLTPERQVYEDFKRAQAIAAADELWKAYQAYCTNSLTWAETWKSEQAFHTFQQQESIDQAAHVAWLQQNQPDRLPPAPVPFRLRATTNEWHPEASRARGDSSTKKSAPENIDLKPGETPGRRKTHRTQHTPSNPRTASVETLESTTSSDSNDNSGLDTPATEVSDEDVSTVTGSDGDAKKSMKKAKWNRTILLFDAFQKHVPVCAMLDPGNQGPNYISDQIVRRLGYKVSFDPSITSLGREYPLQADFNGNIVEVVGMIELDFCWWEEDDVYSPWHRTVFTVAVSPYLQVVFSKDYLEEQGITNINEAAMKVMAPLTANKKRSQAVKQQQAELERIQKQRKAQAEFKRKIADQQQPAGDGNNDLPAQSNDRGT